MKRFLVTLIFALALGTGNVFADPGDGIKDEPFAIKNPLSPPVTVQDDPGGGIKDGNE